MSSSGERQKLKDVYALIAELWCGPPDPDAERDEADGDAERIVEDWQEVDGESATLLSRFLGENTTSEEEYIELFELDPKCALYLGSHTHEEPKTCANSAVSERNGYMINLVGIYNHFGRKPNGSELPDYLPLMVDFLSLSSEKNDDPVRAKLINEFFLPYLPPMRSRLEELKTPYLLLFDALGKVIDTDLKTQST
ncbi:MAG: hypothetical protein QF393_07575 [Rhodospirillales bacterium]|jgi:nitrate reductase delta subunit|nr:hypothetical protein [Rhodospirillales bacterium]|tara:strand:- start:894 stop:1481 length:588 start_codon:yes stop_codon:yes gene_type:complete